MFLTEHEFLKLMIDVKMTSEEEYIKNCEKVFTDTAKDGVLEIMYDDNLFTFTNPRDFAVFNLICFGHLIYVD